MPNTKHKPIQSSSPRIPHRLYSNTPIHTCRNAFIRVVIMRVLADDDVVCVVGKC